MIKELLHIGVLTTAVGSGQKAHSGWCLINLLSTVNKRIKKHLHPARRTTNEKSSAAFLEYRIFKSPKINL